MSQSTSGLYRLVGFPGLYRAIQELLGGSDARRNMVNTLMRPMPNSRILDLGCGSSDVLHYFPQCEYVGIDSNPRHIAAAQSAFGERGVFLCGDFSVADRGDGFDLIIMLGLLHHLDDPSAVTALRMANSFLRRGGRLFTLDPCRVPGQHPVARFLVNRDSGRAVRDEAGYRSLAQTVFPHTEVSLHHNLLRVPYTHCIMNCNLATEEERPKP